MCDRHWYVIVMIALSCLLWWGCGTAPKAETTIAAEAASDTEDSTEDSAAESVQEAASGGASAEDIELRGRALDEREECYKAKQNADSVYAGVSQKERYMAAVEHFRSGDEAYKAGHNSAAYEEYKTARESFTSLYTDISASLAEASRAIQSAKQKRDEAAALAVQADKDKPISEDNENLAASGEVLIQGAAYEDAALSVEDISAEAPAQEVNNEAIE